MRILNRFLKKQKKSRAQNCRKDNSAIEKNSDDRFVMSITDGDGRTIRAELCCFCKKQTDLKSVSKCDFYDFYRGNKCKYFESEEDQKKRFSRLFAER